MFGKVKRLEKACTELEQQLKETHLALDTAVHSLEQLNKKYYSTVQNISVVKSDLYDSYDILKESHKKPTEYMKGIKYTMEKLDAYFPEVNHA